MQGRLTVALKGSQLLLALSVFASFQWQEASCLSSMTL